MVGREEEDYPDEVEERLVNEEYKIWKKNTPFLYGARIASCMQPPYPPSPPNSDSRPALLAITSSPRAAQTW